MKHDYDIEITREKDNKVITIKEGGKVLVKKVSRKIFRWALLLTSKKRPDEAVKARWHVKKSQVKVPSHDCPWHEFYDLVEIPVIPQIDIVDNLPDINFSVHDPEPLRFST